MEIFLEHLLKEMRDDIDYENLKNPISVNIGRLKKFNDLLAVYSTKDYSLYSMLLDFTDFYFVGPKILPYKTMAVALKGERIQFLMYKPFYDGLNRNQLNFLVYHEMEHIKRGHCNKKVTFGRSDHHLANICMDVFINEDALKTSTHGGHRLSVLEDSFVVKTGSYENEGDNHNSKVDLAGVSEFVRKYYGEEAAKKIDHDSIYKMQDSIKLYYYMKNLLKDHKPLTPKDPQPPQPPEPPEKPKVRKTRAGDYVKLKGKNSYGEVIEVDSRTGEISKMRKVSKEEAFKNVNTSGQKFFRINSKIKKHQKDIDKELKTIKNDKSQKSQKSQKNQKNQKNQEKSLTKNNNFSINIDNKINSVTNKGLPLSLSDKKKRILEVFK